MYIVSITNGSVTTEIHNEHHKLLSGSVVKGINTIDSFSFSVLPDNPAFGRLNDFTTLVSVYNTRKQRYEFQGRVLCTSPQMDSKGLITQEATCENFFGFLCDSQQPYVIEQNWGVRGLLGKLIREHNAQVESYKQFTLGTVDVSAPNDNLYEGIQRENTWDAIKKKLIDKLGGELRFRVVEGVTYIDYLKRLGSDLNTEIALSRNMKSIVKEKDPSAFITRLIPLGAKKRENSEERYDITEVNGGKNYIDDTEAIDEYGIHVGYVEFDDVKEPSNILAKGRAWLEENNKVAIKYSITALDLSLINLDVDDFDVYNTHPIKNALLGIDDRARIIKKTIDVCDESKTSIEIGDSFKTLSELQREQMVSLNKVSENIAEIVRNFVTNEKLSSEINKTTSIIEQTEARILLQVSEEYLTDADLSGFLTSKDLDGYATLESLLDYAKTSTLDGYATIEKLSSEIEATKNEINLSVSSTYAQASALTNYATLEKLNSEIALAKESINLSVSSEVISSINKLEIGGRNLLRNTSEMITLDSTSSDYKYAYWTPTVDIIAGEDYVFSADVKFTSGGASQIAVAFTDKTMTVDWSITNLDIINNRVSGVVRATETAKTILQAYAGINGSTRGNIVTFSNVKLEKGNKATDWTPAPEEYATLEKLSSELALTKTGITASVSAEYAKKTDVEGRNLISGTETPTTVTATNSNSYFEPPLTCQLEENTNYTFSADVEVLEGSATHIDLVYKDDNLVLQGDKAAIIDGRVSLTIHTGVDPFLRVYIGERWATSGNKIKFSKMKLEKGDTATPWSLAPENVASIDYVQGSLALQIKTDLETGERYSELSADVDKIVFNSGEMEFKSDNFNLMSDGTLETQWESTYSNGEKMLGRTVLSGKGIEIWDCTEYEYQKNGWGPCFKRVSWWHVQFAASMFINTYYPDYWNDGWR